MNELELRIKKIEERLDTSDFDGKRDLYYYLLNEIRNIIENDEWESLPRIESILYIEKIYNNEESNIFINCIRDELISDFYSEEDLVEFIRENIDNEEIEE